jgi:hypothetical protein
MLYSGPVKTKSSHGKFWCILLYKNLLWNPKIPHHLREAGLLNQSKLCYIELSRLRKIVISPGWSTSDFLIGLNALSKRKQCFNCMLVFTAPDHLRFKP